MPAEAAEYRILVRARGSGTKYPATKVIWQGEDPAKADRSGWPTTLSFTKDKEEKIVPIDYTLEARVGGRWHSIGPLGSGGSFGEAVTEEAPAVDFKSTVTSIRRALDTYADPLKPSTLDEDVAHRQAALAHMEATRRKAISVSLAEEVVEKLRDEEERIRARLVEERKKAAAEEARMKLEQEHAARRDQIAASAAASWDGATPILARIQEAWAKAALREAEVQEKQIEDELLGAVMTVRTEMIWKQACEEVQALLDFAQRRLEEASARAEGAGVEESFEDVEQEQETRILPWAEEEAGYYSNEYPHEEDLPVLGLFSNPDDEATWEDQEMDDMARAKF